MFAKLMGWIDYRFPLTAMYNDHMAKYPAPKNAPSRPIAANNRSISRHAVGKACAHAGRTRIATSSSLARASSARESGDDRRASRQLSGR